MASRHNTHLLSCRYKLKTAYHFFLILFTLWYIILWLGEKKSKQKYFQLKKKISWSVTFIFSCSLCSVIIEFLHNGVERRGQQSYQTLPQFSSVAQSCPAELMQSLIGPLTTSFNTIVKELMITEHKRTGKNRSNTSAYFLFKLEIFLFALLFPQP